MSNNTNTAANIEDAFSVNADGNTNKILKRNIGIALRYLGIPVTDEEIAAIQASCPSTIDLGAFKAIVAEASARQRPDAHSLSQSLLTLLGDGDSIPLCDLKVALYNVPDSSVSEKDIDEWLKDAPVDARGNVSLPYIIDKLK